MKKGKEHKLRVVTIIAHRNTGNLVDKQIVDIQNMTLPNIENDIIVVSAGSDYEHESKHKTFWYPDEPFRGKCYAHNIGLNLLNDKYDYYWFNHPDLLFSDKGCLEKLITLMEAHPEIAVCSPVQNTSYMGKNLSNNTKNYHVVSTVDYLSLCIRKKSVDSLGFLNKEFQYAWGAIVEYSYHVHRQGWCIAFCDNARVTHLGGTTYGAKDTKTISREAYISRARSFCRKYFPEKYGDDWFIKFFDVLPDEVKRLRYSGTSDAIMADTPSTMLEQNPYWIKKINWDIM